MFLFDLFRLKILTGRRLALLVTDVLRHGIQLTNVVRMCINTDAVAIKHGDRTLSYKALFDHIASVSGYLHSTYGIKQGSKILLIIDNSIPSIILLFALSSIGCNIHVLGPMKNYDYFRRSVDTGSYDYIFSGAEEKLDYYDQCGIHFFGAFWDFAIHHRSYKPFVNVLTNLSVFTGGTTGIVKKIKRSNTLWQYLRALVDLVKTLHLQIYDSVILPVPVYHSYGLSALFLSLMLNKRLVLINKFDPTEVGQAIQTNKTDVAILIPQMLLKLLSHDLNSLRCIMCCSDVLPTTVFEKARSKFGDIIFNLYGTSETGLATIATPKMLAAKPATIGRPIDGCRLKLVNQNGNSILHIKSGFAMRRGYINTGDIVTQDEQGWFFYHGRVDHLIVINGVNVYPAELIDMAHKHELVQHVAVEAYTNENGFKKIKLILQLSECHALEENQFIDWWLQSYGTRFLPSRVEFRKGNGHIKLMDR